MPGFTDVTINKISGQLQLGDSNEDSVGGLIIEMPATTGLTHGTVELVENESDLEALGISEDFDAENRVLAYRHVKEFFEYAPNGVLYIMAVPRDTTLSVICDMEDENAYLYNFLQEQTAIRFAGIVKNPTEDYIFTTENGIDQDTLDAIAKAQSVVNSLHAANRYIDSIILEGRNLAETINNIPDLRAYDSENISVMCGQNSETAAADTLYAGYGAVGALLGAIAVRKVSESAGSVDIENKPEDKKEDENYPLNWDKAQLSSGLNTGKISTAYHKRLRDRGIIYAANHEGYEGIYLSGQDTCTGTDNDFRYINHNRTWNKAARLALATMIRMLQSGVDYDDDGNIESGVVATLEGKVANAVSQMKTDNEISNYKINIAANQNIQGENPLNVKIQVQPRGILYKISGDLMFYI